MLFYPITLAPNGINESLASSPDAIPDTASYPLFCEQFAASIASTSNNAGISLLGLSYSMTYVSPQLRSFYVRGRLHCRLHIHRNPIP